MPAYGEDFARHATAAYAVIDPRPLSRTRIDLYHAVALEDPVERQAEMKRSWIRALARTTPPGNSL